MLYLDHCNLDLLEPAEYNLFEAENLVVCYNWRMAGRQHSPQVWLVSYIPQCWTAFGDDWQQNLEIFINVTNDTQ